MKKALDIKKFLLIVPCYNEEKSLRHLIEDKILSLYHKCKERYSLILELIIVDDASKDKSLEIAEQLQKNTLGFRYINMLKIKGKGRLLKQGFPMPRGMLLVFKMPMKNIIP